MLCPWTLWILWCLEYCILYPHSLSTLSTHTLYPYSVSILQIIIETSASHEDIEFPLCAHLHANQALLRGPPGETHRDKGSDFNDVRHKVFLKRFTPFYKTIQVRLNGRECATNNLDTSKFAPVKDATPRHTDDRILSQHYGRLIQCHVIHFVHCMALKEIV